MRGRGHGSPIVVGDQVLLATADVETDEQLVLSFDRGTGCDFQVHQGFGSSPVIYQNIVLISADHRGSGKMTGLNKLVGEIVWRGIGHWPRSRAAPARLLRLHLWKRTGGEPWVGQP